MGSGKRTFLVVFLEIISFQNSYFMVGMMHQLFLTNRQQIWKRRRKVFSTQEESKKIESKTLWNRCYQISGRLMCMRWEFIHCFQWKVYLVVLFIIKDPTAISASLILFEKKKVKLLWAETTTQKYFSFARSLQSCFVWRSISHLLHCRQTKFRSFDFRYFCLLQ